MPTRFPIPASVTPERWTDALRNYAVAADITGSQAVKPADRNGLAVGKPTHQNDPAGYSNIGLFSDRWGNQIWITGDSSPKFALFEKHNLAGRLDPWLIPMPRFFGSTGPGDTALTMWLQPNGEAKLQSYPDNHHIRIMARGPVDALGTNGSIRYFGWKEKYGYVFEYSSAIGILNNLDLLCQKLGHGLDRPVLILYGGEPVTWQTIAATFLQVATILCQVVAPFASSLPIAGLKALVEEFTQVVQVLASSAEFIASGGVITASNFRQFLMPVANVITPNAWRGTLNDGATVFEAVSRGDFRTVAKTLNIDTSLASYFDLRDPLAQLDAIESSASKQVKSIIENFNALHMIDNVGKWAANPTAMATSLLEHESELAAVPFVQNLFLNGAGQTAVQLVPNLQNVVELALHQAADTAIEDGGPVMWGQMSLNALGWPVDPAVFDPMAYAALRQQVRTAKRLAYQIGQRLHSFPLPVTVPASKRSMFAAYLQEDEGIRVDLSGGSHWLNFIPYAEFV